MPTALLLFASLIQVECDIRVRIRPGGQGMHLEDSGANGFELRVAAPSADTALKDVAYFVTS